MNKNKNKKMKTKKSKQLKIEIPKCVKRKKEQTIFVNKYVPKYLSNTDKKKQISELKKSIRLQKIKKYHIREKIKSFKSKTSNHIKNAKRIYQIKSLKPNKELEKKTKCKLIGLEKIVKKGVGAYFTSGSRPSQTPHSWAYARLASAITGGKSAKVDIDILKKYCKKNSLPIKFYNKKYKK